MAMKDDEVERIAELEAECEVLRRRLDAARHEASEWETRANAALAVAERLKRQRDEARDLADALGRNSNQRPFAWKP